MNVFNFGSINVDMVYRVPHLVQPGETLASRSLVTVLGGKGANQSVALARAGIDVQHIGRIGVADEWAAAQMAAAGVGMDHVEAIDGASGHAIIQVDDAGENSIILHGGANQSFDAPVLEAQLGTAAEGDWLLMQNECNGLDVAFDVAVRHGLSIAFNPAPMAGNVMALPLERCAVLIVNETEAAELAGAEDPEAALAILAARYPQTRVVLTLGAAGAMLQVGTRQIRQPATAVQVVDTTGAGDTFVGYFMAGLIQAMDDASALGRACRAAALSVTVAGAAPSIPTAVAVDNFQEPTVPPCTR
ncbi:MAG: ribokinase [Granulosicoccus sp.]|nr:ribokinase [Granulosicoccus sp.]